MTLKPVASAPAPPAQALPDLVVLGVEPEIRDPRAGQRVHFSVTVANRGEADAGEFQVRLGGDEIRQEVTVPGLPAGQSVTLRMGPRVTDLKSLYQVQADVDPANRVPESREDNNWLIALLPGPRPPQPPPEPPRPPIPPWPPGRP